MKQFDLACEGLFDKLRSYIPTLKQTMQGQKDTREDQLRNRLMIGGEKLSKDIIDYVANMAQTLEAQSGKINYSKDYQSVNWKDEQELIRALDAIQNQYPKQYNNVKLAYGVYLAYQNFINRLYGNNRGGEQQPEQLSPEPPAPKPQPQPRQLPAPSQPRQLPAPPQRSQLPGPPQRPQLSGPPQRPLLGAPSPTLPKARQLSPPSGPSRGTIQLQDVPKQLPSPTLPKARQLPPPSGPSRGTIQLNAPPKMRRRGPGGRFIKNA